MDIRKEFESEADEHQMILADQCQCCLCGSDLEFSHQIDYLTFEVIEDADCPSCKIRLKTKSHGLH